MVALMYEKPNFSSNTSTSKPRASVSLRSRSAGSLCWNKDRGSIADTGGSASGMDNRRLRLDASEPESLDAQGERGRPEFLNARSKDRASCPSKPGDSSAIGGAVGETSSGIWAKSCPLGWSNLGCALKTLIWDKVESSSGSVLDAPVGLLPKACQLFLSSGKERRGQKVSFCFKKNSSPWDLVETIVFEDETGLRVAPPNRYGMGEERREASYPYQ